MKTHSVLLVSLIALAGASLVLDTVSARPTAESARGPGKQTEGELNVAHGVPASVLRGPGTQTEGELNIGAKGKTPQKAKAEQTKRAKPSSRARGGDDDLEDLEVQRARLGIKANAR